MERKSFFLLPLSPFDILQPLEVGIGKKAAEAFFSSDKSIHLEKKRKTSYLAHSTFKETHREKLGLFEYNFLPLEHLQMPSDQDNDHGLMALKHPVN